MYRFSVLKADKSLLTIFGPNYSQRTVAKKAVDNLNKEYIVKKKEEVISALQPSHNIVSTPAQLNDKLKFDFLQRISATYKNIERDKAIQQANYVQLVMKDRLKILYRQTKEYLKEVSESNEYNVAKRKVLELSKKGEQILKEQSKVGEKFLRDKINELRSKKFKK